MPEVLQTPQYGLLWKQLPPESKFAVLSVFNCIHFAYAHYFFTDILLLLLFVRMCVCTSESFLIVALFLSPAFSLFCFVFVFVLFAFALFFFFLSISTNVVRFPYGLFTFLPTFLPSSVSGIYYYRISFAHTVYWYLVFRSHCPAFLHYLQVAPSSCTTPQDFMSRMQSQMGLHPVQTIGQEMICAGKAASAGNSVVLVHGKIKPGRVEMMVKSHNAQAINTVNGMLRKALV